MHHKSKVNELVQLDGSNRSDHDPDGSTLNYSWNQTKGPEVILNDATIVNPTFTALATNTQYWYDCYNDSVKWVTERIESFLKRKAAWVGVKGSVQSTNEE